MRTSCVTMVLDKLYQTLLVILLACVLTKPIATCAAETTDKSVEDAGNKNSELHQDFTIHYSLQAGPSSGPNQTRYEFPGIAKLRDGRLLTLYIDEIQDPTPPWAASPTCGRLLLAHSGDIGRTWSKPRLFLNTPLDDRHAYALQLDNGDLLAFFWIQPASLGLIDGCFNYVTASHDGGNTWEDPVRFRTGRRKSSPLAEPTVVGGCSLTSPPIKLPDGSLAMAVHTILPGNKPPIEIGILRSHDHGRTWGDYTTVASDPKVCFVEPSVARLASGKWIIVTRTETPITPGTTHPYRQGPTMICESTDEGKTWSKPARLPLEFTWDGPGNPFVLQTKSGVVVFAVMTGTAFSYDEGKTWVPQDMKLGYYPNLIEIEPGTLATLACGMSGKVFSLTKPRPGVTPLAVSSAPVQRELMPSEAAAHRAAVAAKLKEITGPFRTIRVRQPRDRRYSPLLAQPSQTLLAVGRAVSEQGPVIAAAQCNLQGQWQLPLIAAASPDISGDPLVVQSLDGSVLCAFPTAAENGVQMVRITSSDGGASWTPPTPMSATNHKNFCFTSPPVEGADKSWLVAAETDIGERSRIGVFHSQDSGKSWQILGECPKPDGAKQWIEPSLTVTRDGRWVVLARETDLAGNGQTIVVTVSSDQGKTWNAPRNTEIDGCRPEIVELLDDLFLVLAENEGGGFRTAFAWDELSHFLVRDLACGYCLQLDGQKYLARGSGIDLAGEFNNLAQVPLETGEIEAARRKATVQLPCSHEIFHFHGNWRNHASDKADSIAMTSAENTASIEIEFEGPIALLVHDMSNDGRLVEVRIDGKEYPPVDMLGTPKTAVSTCLAAGLKDGSHKLTLKPLLPWKSGSMTVRGLELSKSK